MSTRSAIIRKTEDGYEGIYCHHDGYIEHVGKILYEDYQTKEKLDRLFALGDLSSLGERVEPIGKHTYTEPERGTTIAYHRDRGEDYNPPVQGKTVKEVENQIDHDGYVYVYDGFWTVNGEPLAEKLAEIGVKP